MVLSFFAFLFLSLSIFPCKNKSNISSSSWEEEKKKKNEELTPCATQEREKKLQVIEDTAIVIPVYSFL